MNRDLGAGYSFERKPSFVCGSLSHLIKDCDYYEKKMAREAALKSKRVVHAISKHTTGTKHEQGTAEEPQQFVWRKAIHSSISNRGPTPIQMLNVSRVHKGRPNL
ncbi:hypothetical protein Tco_1177029 [Tanacetum coccineum]